MTVFAALTLALALTAGQARAEDDINGRQVLSDWARVAENVQALLRRPMENAAKLEGDYHDQLLQISVEAKNLAAEKSLQLEPLIQQRAALSGPEEAGPENANLIREQKKLDEQIANVTAIRNQADREAKRSDSLVLAIATARRQRLTSSLLIQGPSPANPTAWFSLLSALKDTGADLQRVLTILSRRIDNPVQSALSVFLGIVVALGIGFVFQRRFDRSMRLYYKRKPATPKRRLVYAILFTLQRVTLLLSAILVGTLFVYLSVDFTVAQSRALAFVPLGLIVLVFSYALVQAIFAPDDETLRIVEFDDDLARGMARNILLVIFVLVIDRNVIGIGQWMNWPLDALAAANFVAVLLAAYFFYRIARLASLPATSQAAGPDAPDEDTDDQEVDAAIEIADSLDYGRILGFAALVVGVGALIASLLGYFALSRYFLTGVIRSGGVIGICLVLYTAFSQVGALTFGRSVEEGEDPQAPWWFTMSMGLVLTMVALPLIALVWGASPNDITLVYANILEGKDIGGVQIAPVLFLLALAVFPLLLLVTRILKRYLERRILPRTSLDPGARSSIVAGAGYLGVTIAALVGISVAGFDLSKLALVAGALSVGIGFGLQNIVGNFVSGLILLIERPIKTGDWVVVGGQHGTVKRINVRATQIDTFDRSTLIVPNTEFISTTVENWTHRNSIGRVIVPIGVAYGTDPLKVQKILEEIAEGNSSILPRPAPAALFRGFGDSALNFELRGYLRDVNNILVVENDVCLEIDRRFREEGIEIPFPQRVVHMRGSAEQAPEQTQLPPAYDDGAKKE